MGMMTMPAFLMAEKLAGSPQVEQGSGEVGRTPKLALCSPPDCQGGLCEPEGGLKGCQAADWVPSSEHGGNSTGVG